MKKRITSLLLCLCLLLALVPAVSLPAAASTNGHSQADAVAWATSQVGKALDYDNAYGAQCVDLIKYYYAYLGNAKYGTGNASNYVSNAIPSGWTRVKSNPQPGDVIVWGANAKLSSGYALDKYGHVGIVVAVNGGKLTTVEQIAYKKCIKTTREASYVTCYIHPDFSDGQPEKDPYPGDKPGSGKNYSIANKASGRLLDVYGGNDTSTSKSNVQIWDAIGSIKSQRFNLVETSNGWWNIIPLSNTSLAVNCYSYTPQDGTNVNVYPKENGDNTQGWYFEAVDGGYYIIHSAFDKNVVLTAEGKDNKSNVKLATNTKSDYQLWKLTVDGEEDEKPQPHEHDYSAEETKPTCTEEGFTTHACKTCGDSYKDSTVPALGHEFKDGVCTRCGEADGTAGTEQDGIIILQIGNPEMVVNGESMAIDPEGSTPQLINNRTILPLGAVFKALGGTAGWDPDTGVVTLKKDGKTLYLKFGGDFCWDDSGKVIPLDVAPIIQNNRTLLPLGAVLEYFGNSVEWEGASMTITIQF